MSSFTLPVVSRQNVHANLARNSELEPVAAVGYPPAHNADSEWLRPAPTKMAGTSRAASPKIKKLPQKTFFSIQSVPCDRVPAARFMCRDKVPRQVFVIQLEEARAEWRRRCGRCSNPIRRKPKQASRPGVAPDFLMSWRSLSRFRSTLHDLTDAIPRVPSSAECIPVSG
jgi:hypothetical protein